MNRTAPLYRKHKVEDVKKEEEAKLMPVVEILYGIPKRMSHLFEGTSPSTQLNKKEARNVLLKRVKELNQLGE